MSFSFPILANFLGKERNMELSAHLEQKLGSVATPQDCAVYLVKNGHRLDALSAELRVAYQIWKAIEYIDKHYLRIAHQVAEVTRWHGPCDGRKSEYDHSADFERAKQVLKNHGIEVL